ncbi:MAG: ATP-binding cassette domain-containing protein [Eubacteriales bacterium]|nr:ATP-binding cassette domain-containing protein [Eubacteriales bacterium]
MIEISNVSKQYNDKYILQNVSHIFKGGEITCVMGKSGSGKTTLLRLLMGLEIPDEGSIKNDDSISVVFQENRLVKHLTPVTNIKMIQHNPDKKSIEKELCILLDEDSIYKKCEELSGGMQRRVEIVRAMMADSQVVIMDEPFAGLDEVNKDKAIKYIIERANNRTLIITTHDINDAKKLGGTVMVVG